MRTVNKVAGERGFGMVEVLVSLLVICIGVLGMVALQSRTVQYTQDSVQRNTAIALANDLVELMRVRVSAINPVIPEGYLKADDASFPALPTIDCSTTPVDPGEQLACWSRRASLLLPGAENLLVSDFHICRSNGSSGCSATEVGRIVEIQLAWKVKAGECLDGTDNTKCHYLLRTQL